MCNQRAAVIGSLQIQSSDTQRTTVQDQVLSQICSYMLDGWPTSSSHLTVNNRWFLWGYM